MEFRRSGQRDDRRRRLLAEESCGQMATAGPTATPSAGSPAVCRKSDHYGDAAFMDESLRLIDLVPRRPAVFGLLLMVALGAVAGLEALYAWAAAGPNQFTTDGMVAAFDLDGEGSLAVWFSSVCLLASSVVAALVYTVRRHRTDDYHGHYRVWLWAASCWLVMSLDETASLHEGFMGLMTYVTGTPIYGDGSIWWVVPYFFMLGAVGSRLLVDMRACRLSSAALLATAGCYAAAVVVQVLGDGLTRAVMLEEGAEMVGDVFLLLAMGLHARYVILDAEGLLPARRRRDVDLPEEEPDEAPVPVLAPASAQRITIDPPHPAFRSDVKRPVGQRPARPAKPEPAPVSPVQRKLTKQEKKALRERLTRERLKREQQKQRGW